MRMEPRGSNEIHDFSRAHPTSSKIRSSLDSLTGSSNRGVALLDAFSPILKTPRLPSVRSRASVESDPVRADHPGRSRPDKPPPRERYASILMRCSACGSRRRPEAPSSRIPHATSVLKLPRHEERDLQRQSGAHLLERVPRRGHPELDYCIAECVAGPYGAYGQGKTRS